MPASRVERLVFWVKFIRRLRKSTHTVRPRSSCAADPAEQRGCTGGRADRARSAWRSLSRSLSLYTDPEARRRHSCISALLYSVGRTVPPATHAPFSLSRTNLCGHRADPCPNGLFYRGSSPADRVHRNPDQINRWTRAWRKVNPTRGIKRGTTWTYLLIADITLEYSFVVYRCCYSRLVN